MKEYELPEKNFKLLLEDDFLALTSETEVTTVSSAVYNGGFRKAKAVINAHAPEDYDQKLLHEHPEHLILKVLRKLNLNPDYSVGMITAADINKFSVATADEDGLSVSAVVTAGCSLAETSGEEIKTTPFTPGTINTIIAINGNPTESCLLETFITATEAKTAGLRDLDVRSAYSGAPATGTITDSLAVLSTDNGPKIKYGGPASKLGRLVGYCTRKAVKDAILKNGNYLIPTRSVLKRFSERKLPIEELVREISKTGHVEVNVEEINSRIIKALREKPLLSLVLMMAANMDEEVKKGLVPEEFGEINILSEEFQKSFFRAICKEENFHRLSKLSNVNQNSNLFLKNALLCIIEEVL
ncbi:MAG: adenosylcobinamide amidohydrolase [Candidatus Bathyarchaeales archaeon]